MISAPEPGDGADGPMEQSPENQGPTSGPSRGGVEAEVNTLGDEKSNDANDIITASDDLLPHDPVMAQPTLDNLVEDDVAEGPQAEGEEPGEANELVEDIAAATGKNRKQNKKTPKILKVHSVVLGKKLFWGRSSLTVRASTDYINLSSFS